MTDGQHLGRDPEGDPADYFPGRPAEVEPQWNVPDKGVYGLPLGGRPMESEAEQAQALTHLGIEACRTTLAVLQDASNYAAGVVVSLNDNLDTGIKIARDRAGIAVSMFLAAGSGSRQDTVREAVELAAVSQERMDEAIQAVMNATEQVLSTQASMDLARQAVGEAIQVAERIVW